jgi:hypothetical protein
MGSSITSKKNLSFKEKIKALIALASGLFKACEICGSTVGVLS